MATSQPGIMVLVDDGWNGEQPEIPEWVYRHAGRQGSLADVAAVPSEWRHYEFHVGATDDHVHSALRKATELELLGIVFISADGFDAMAFCREMLRFMAVSRKALPICVYDTHVPRGFLIVQPDGSWQPYPGDPESRR